MNLRAVALLVGCGAIAFVGCGSSSDSHSAEPKHTTSTSSTTATKASCSDPDATDGGLIKNGGFETPVAPRGGYLAFAPGKDVDGWLVIGAPGNVSPLSKDFAEGALTWPAHTGDQTLDLTGLSNTATGVSQTVVTKEGQPYVLSFWTANIVNPTGIYGTTTTTNVMVDGEQVLAARNDGGAGTNTLSWKRFCVPFTAKTGSTEIAFVNGDPSTDNSDILDDVGLQ